MPEQQATAQSKIEGPSKGAARNLNWKRTRSWLARAAVVALVLLFSTALVLWRGGPVWVERAMRDSLPLLDGSERLGGLGAPVTVRRDAHGVPHISAASLDDLFAAQGYVTAQDRLWEMDMARRSAGGEVAEVLGGRFLAHDTEQRVLQTRRTAEGMAAALTAQDRRFYEAYARGVNAFIDGHSDHLPVEFRLLRYRPRPWVAADSLVIGLGMVQILDQRFDEKLG